MASTLHPDSRSGASSASRADAYLDALNAQQRFAVEFGVSPNAAQGPLLVIAGAGSGKTNTLAHRVAHLVVQRRRPAAHPAAHLLAPRAAEMERRGGRMLQPASSGARRPTPPALPGPAPSTASARGCCASTPSASGSHAAFTIHDRGDSADLIAIRAPRARLCRNQEPLPAKGTCLAIYSRAVNSEAPLERVLAKTLSLVRAWEAELKQLFAAYVEAKQAQNVLDYDDLLLYWAHMMARAGAGRAKSGARFDHVLVDEYQDTNRLQAEILLALKPDGRGLTVVGDDAQAIYSFRAATVRNILDFPTQFPPPARGRHAGAQLPLDAADPRRRQRGDRAGRASASRRSSGASGERREKPQLVTVRDEAEQARCVAEQVLEQREAGMPLKSQAVLFRSRTTARAGAGAGAAQHPVREVRRAEVPRGGARQGCARASCAGPRTRAAGWRGFASRSCCRASGPATAARLLDAMDAAAGSGGGAGGVRRAAGGGRGLAGVRRACSALLRRETPLARRAWSSSRAGTSRTCSASTTTPPCARAISSSSSRSRRPIASRERFLTELTLDPPERHQRPRPASPHLDEDYLDPVDHPLGQGPGVEHGVRAERGRRLHSVGHGHRDAARRSRRSGACSTWR